MATYEQRATMNASDMRERGPAACSALAESAMRDMQPRCDHACHIAGLFADVAIIRYIRYL